MAPKRSTRAAAAAPARSAPALAAPAVHVPPPSYWSTTSGINVIPNMERMDEMQNLVSQTWRVKYTRDRKATGCTTVPTGARVLMVLRVENHECYQIYAAERERIRTRRRGGCTPFEVATSGAASAYEIAADVNEMLLFHGTSPVAADAIARSDFRLDKAGSAVGTMFGPGIYLAENASKSDEYAKEGEGVFMGQCALLLCRATAGKVFTTPDKGDARPNVISGGGDHDCVCGDRLAAVGTFREMIFFDEASVCTEFIILYARSFDEIPSAPSGALAAAAAPAATPAATPAAAPAPAAASAPDVTAQTWDDVITEKNSIQHDFCGGFNTPVEVSVDPCGSFALVSNYSGNDVVRIDLQSGKQIAAFGGFNHPVQSAIARSGSFALIANAGGGVTKISLPEGRVLHTFTQFSSAKGVVVSPDESFALIGDCGNSIGRIDLKSNEVSFPYKVKFGGNSVSIASDGSFALFADYGSGQVGRIDLDNGAVTFPYKVPFAHGVAIAPDDAYALVGMKGDSVGYVNLKTGEVDLKRYAGFKGALGLCIVPDGTYALVANIGSNSLSKIVLRDAPLLNNVTEMAAPAAAAPANRTAEPGKQMCKMGCGRKVAPPSGKRVFDTCCRKCAQGEGHKETCCPD